METTASAQRVSMEEITALAKRRGFIFQSSEIYGGINGFWDYGPLGAVLKRNVKDAWWRDTVERRLIPTFRAPAPNGNRSDRKWIAFVRTRRVGLD